MKLPASRRSDSAPCSSVRQEELDSLLSDVGLRRSDLALTNVFNQRPPGNSLLAWATTKKEADAAVSPSLPYHAIQAETGKWVHPSKVQPALVRLREEILAVQPNLIIAMGNTAMSAICNVSGIGKIRGTIYQGKLLPVKTIGTYHPAAVLRQYELRSTVEIDLMKAKREAEFPELRLRRRVLYLEPTVRDLRQWYHTLSGAPALTVDCETSRGQITCVGFSPDAISSYVVPFWDRRRSDWSYWPTLDEEFEAWLFCYLLLTSDSIKILQNGLYDLQYFLRYRWPMRRFVHDTMIKFHTSIPAFPKVWTSLDQSTPTSAHGRNSGLEAVRRKTMPKICSIAITGDEYFATELNAAIRDMLDNITDNFYDADGVEVADVAYVLESDGTITVRITEGDPEE